MLGQAVVDVLFGGGVTKVDQTAAEIEGRMPPSAWTSLRNGFAVQVNDPAMPVENDQAVGAVGDGHGGEAGFEEAEALDAGMLSEGKLDLFGCKDGERDVVAAEDFGRAGDVDQTDDALVHRVSDRGAGAGPALDALAEMLGGVHEDRLSGGERRADAVGTDDTLVPVTARLQLDVVAGVEGAGVAAGVENDPVFIGQHHHRRRLFEEVGGVLERVVRRGEQLPALPLAAIELVVVDHQRRRRSVGVNPGSGASGPGKLDDVPHLSSAAGRFARQKLLPGAHGPRLVIGRLVLSGGRTQRCGVAGGFGH